MAPAYAVPRMLNDAHYALQDFDFYEIHEAFRGSGAVHAQGLGRSVILPR